MITSKIRKAAQLWAFSMRPFRPPALLIIILLLIIFPSPESFAQVIGRPPVITNQPISQIAAAGTNVTFSVGVAPSSTPLSYQWQTLADAQNVGAVIAGANSATLVLTNVQLTAGRNYYSVVVANAAGSVTSAAASLTVFQVSDQSVSLGVNVALKANSISSGVGATFVGDYQWQFNGFSIGGATNRSLAITNVQLANGGIYSVLVTNDVGAATASARLDVDPTFTKITTGSIVTDIGFSFGVDWGDYDNDGFLDLFVANGLNQAGKINFLYHNDGNGAFTRIMTGSVATDQGTFGEGAWADYDNDGFLDLFVNNLRGNSLLYHNNRDGTFTSITTNIVATAALSTSPSWTDYDQDGFIDLFVPNFQQKSFLYRNNGDGSFTQITSGAIVNDIAASQAGTWGDYDNDGDDDLFVGQNANGGGSLFYRNNGDGTFTRITGAGSVAGGGASIVGVWGDYNNDGFLDLLVTHPGDSTDLLYRNNGDGSFTRVTTGPIASDRAQSIGAAWGDYDNDGFLDLFVANGQTSGENNFLYHNNGDGTFAKITSGSLVNDGGHSLHGHWADYDNDGFLDLFVANTSGEKNFLYRNSGNSNTWIKIKCVGTVSNRSGIGAKVRVKTQRSAGGPVFGVRQLDAALDSGVRLLDDAFDPKRGQARALQSAEPPVMWQLMEIESGGGVSTGLLAHFGLGDATNIDTVRIEWPSGIVQELRNVTPKQFLTVTESGVAIFPRVADMVVGSNHVFTAKATFAGSLRYQWSFNGADLPGETNAALSVSSVGASSAGEYSVVVRDAAGVVLAASSPALLRWTDAPVIRAQPQSQIALAGTDVTLSVGVVLSATALSFQWFKDGNPLPALSLPTLVLTNAQTIDGGSYTVAVNNDFFTVTSAVADVTIIKDTSVSGSLGANVTLRITPAGPTLSYQWRLNGANIPNATQNSYVITNAQPSNVGQYSVVVANGSATFTNLLPALVVDPTFTKVTDNPITKGAGVIAASWGDYNNDGWLDLVVSPAIENDVLYRNNGDGTFTKASFSGFGSHICPVWADYDNDGNLDLFDVSYQAGLPNHLYHNNGDGTFKQMTAPEAGPIATDGGSNFTTAAWADYDQDGYVDLIVPSFNGARPFLYHNNGNGSFTKITNSASVSIVREAASAWGVAWADFDNDGDPDVFLANYGPPNAFHVNNGDGTFTNSMVLSSSPLRKSTTATWADFDNDGNLDLFVAGANTTGNTFNLLYRNNGNGTFTRITNGVVASEPAQGVISRIGAWGDYDNDGYLDLFVANSSTDESGNLVGGPTKSFLYHNNGDGTFSKIISGSPVNDFTHSYQACWGDYDNNGFLDLFVANFGGNNLLFRNSGNSNSWIKFKLIGTQSNRSAIGAKVRVKTLGSAGSPVFGVRQLDAALDSGVRLLDATFDPKRGQARALQSGESAAMWQLREVISGSGLGSPNQIEPHFGLGNATNIDTVRIEWPSGIVQELHNVATKQFLTVTEPALLIGPKTVEFPGGADVTFSVITNLTLPTNYQWRFNNADLPGETNAKLSVRGVGSSNVGKYTVRLTLPNGGTVESSASVIKPPVPPSITTQPASLALNPGESATFVVAASGSPPLQYQWRLNGDLLASATDSTLVVANAQPENVGDYTVEVRNAGGSITSTNATLTLVGAAKIGTQPQDQSVSLVATVTFSATPSGTPPFTFQWRMNGADISGATAARLTITNVTLANHGQRYSLVVRNALGSATSREATLDVDPTFSKITTGPIVSEPPGIYVGATWGDYNNDGFIDLFVGNSGAVNRLYQNNGDGSFTRITTGGIVNDASKADATVWGDYDNDGYLDLFVSNFPGVKFLYHNNGDGSFTRILAGQIVSDQGLSTGAVWGDYDNDGFLDLFVAHWDQPNLLFHNNGDGTFSGVQAGKLTSEFGQSPGASWGDFNNDGLLDLFVANFGGANFLYQNNGQGSFTKITTGKIVTDIANSWGGAWADYDNDGFLDLFVANLGDFGEKNNFLYHNNGDGTFTRVTNAGPIVSDPAYAHNCVWADYDNDGYIDLFVTNPNGPKNFLYHNKGDGTFEKITTGSLVNDQSSPGYGSRTCSWGDYDNDGFLDLFTGGGHSTGSTIPGVNYLYRNNGNSNGWLKLKLVGTASNRSAIGAKVRVHATIGGKTFWQLREASGGGGKSSQSGLLPHFGLGNATNIDTVRIEWPSGIVQELRNVATKQFLTVTEPPRLSGLTRKADGSAQLSLIGASGLSARVEVSTNLLNWTPLMTVTNRARIETFIDPAAKNFPQRFYRAEGP